MSVAAGCQSLPLEVLAAVDDLPDELLVDPDEEDSLLPELDELESERDPALEPWSFL